MDLRQLRNFIRIVELNSITAAAEDLGVAQPALSRQVKALEDELKVMLLRRHGRGVTPTREGLRLARRASVIIEDVDSLRGEMGGEAGMLTGTVTLGLPPTVAEILATHLIERTLAEHPGVKLRIVSGFSGHVQDWLARGKVDLGVAYEGQRSPKVSARPILIEQLFLIERADAQPVAPRPADAGLLDAPIDALQALSQRLILPNPEHGLRGRIDAIAQERGIPLNVVLEIDILPTMLAFVERGLGSTILPLVSVVDHVRAGRLIARPFLGDPIDRKLVVMTSLSRPGSRLLTGMAAFLTGEVHRLVTSGHWPGTKL